MVLLGTPRAGRYETFSFRGIKTFIWVSPYSPDLNLSLTSSPVYFPLSLISSKLKGEGQDSLYLFVHYISLCFPFYKKNPFPAVPHFQTIILHIWNEVERNLQRVLLPYPNGQGLWRLTKAGGAGAVLVVLQFILPFLMPYWFLQIHCTCMNNGSLVIRVLVIIFITQTGRIQCFQWSKKGEVSSITISIQKELEQIFSDFL